MTAGITHKSFHFAKDFESSPRVCKNAGSTDTIYSPFCDQIISPDRKAFTICHGCSDSRSLPMSTRIAAKNKPTI